MTELEQLRKFAEWERTHNPDPSGRKHVAEWAADEIKRLREALDAANLERAELLAALEGVLPFLTGITGPASRPMWRLTVPSQ